MVQDLVNHVLGAGTWLDQAPQNREKAIQIAAGRKFFNQDPNVLRFVMTEPPDRVTYGDLRMVPREFDELMQMSADAGTLNLGVFEHERFGLETVNEALDAIEQRAGGFTNVVVVQ